jgi:prophage regulatory protein
MPSDIPRIITKKELRLMVPYTVQHIARLEKAGRFPKRIIIGPRRVAWRLSDIEAWLNERAASGTLENAMPENS